MEFTQKAMGSDQWWEIVMTSQMHEAEALLKQYKAVLLSKHNGQASQSNAAAQIARINQEMHRFSQIQNRASMSQAVKNICGEDVFAQVREEMARLEFMARQEFGAPPC